MSHQLSVDPEDLATSVERAAIAALLPAARKSLMMSVLSVAVFSTLLWRFSPTGMATWIGLRVVFSGAALALLGSAVHNGWSTERSLSALNAAMGGSGIVWGLIPLFVQPSDPEWRAVVALWLFGNQSLITAVCSLSREVFRWAIGTVTLVGALTVASAGDSFGLVLAGVLLLGGIYSLMIHQSMHRAVLSAIEGQLVTAALASELSAQQNELRDANCALEVLASRDGLTSLPNRRAFSAAVSDQNGRVAAATMIGFIDLDSFKQINDSRGHSTGDVVLETVAKRWRRLLPEGAMLARMGGDEFALHLPGCDEPTAREIAGRLVLALDRPIEVGDGCTVSVSCSVGLAEANLGEDFAAVMAQADAALYEIKERGGCGFAFRGESVLGPATATTSAADPLSVS